MKSSTPTLPATLPSLKAAMPQLSLPQTTVSPRDQSLQQSQLTAANTATSGQTRSEQVPTTASVNLPYQSEPQLSSGSTSEAQGQPVQYTSLPPQGGSRSQSTTPLSNVVTPSFSSVTGGGLQGFPQQMKADTGTVTVAAVKNGSSEAPTNEPGIAELSVSIKFASPL